MVGGEHWTGKIIYDDLKRSIPDFKNLDLGKDKVFNDDEGKPSAMISTSKVKTLAERADNFSKTVIGGDEPKTVIELIGQKAVKQGLNVGISIAKGLLGNVDELTEKDFELIITDFKSNISHRIIANHDQEKATFMWSEPLPSSADELERPFIRKATNEFHDHLNSQEFKNLFAGSNQMSQERA